LLSLVAGLKRPESGTIDWNEEQVADRHRLALVFQRDTLLPWLTAAENVGLFYRYHRHHKGEVGAWVRQLMELAGLTSFASAYPRYLSGGMRRRVAFLTAVASKPAVLLLDEPFSSLDEPTRLSIHQDVLEIIRRLNMTVLLVTHDLAEAISLSDRVVILTNRPATVFHQHLIPFGRNRDVLSLRETSEFLTIYGALWHGLSLQIGRR
jgi:ABC-type nitrate/sulfonate/bicarbonate transport system ATPase subunit